MLYVLTLFPMRALSTALPTIKHHNSWRLCCFRMRRSSKCSSKTVEFVWRTCIFLCYVMFHFLFTRLYHARRV